MKKALKIILRTISGLIIFLITLPLLVSIILQIEAVQKFAVDKTTEILSETLGTNVSVSSVALKFFTSAELGDIYMEDTNGDTLISANKLLVDIRGINFLTGKITLGEVELTQGVVNLRQDSLGQMNISEVFSKLSSDTSSSPIALDISATELNLRDCIFSFKKYGATPSSRVNFSDLELSNIELEARNIYINGNDLNFSLKGITLKEKSGLRLEKFGIERVSIDSTGMHFSDIELQTPYSDVRLQSVAMELANTSPRDWGNFADSVQLLVELTPSTVSSATLDRFFPVSLPSVQSVKIAGFKLEGTLSNIEGELLDLDFVGNKLNARCHITGLPNLRETRLEGEITQILATQSTIESALSAIGASPIKPNEEAILANLEQITLSAKVTSSVRRLDSKFEIVSSSSGNINGELNMINDGKQIELLGSLSTSDYNLGKTLGVEQLGRTSIGGGYILKLEQNNRDNQVVFDADLRVSKLEFAKYVYSDIVVDGEFRSGQFNGLISSKDSNFMMDINGLFDYSDIIPHYRLSADFHRANLRAIGLNPRDSLSILSAKFTANCSGTSIDDLNGTARFDSIFYVNEIDTVQAAAIDFEAIAEPEFREININSRFADIRLRGRNSFNEIIPYLSNSLRRFLPSFPEVSSIAGSDNNKSNIPAKETTFPFSDGYYLFSVEVKEGNNIASAFVPTLEIAEGTSLNFFFNPYLDQLSLRLKSDYITSDDFLIEGINVDSRNISDSLSIYATANFIAIQARFFPNFALLGGIHDNVISLGVQYRNRVGSNSALLNTTTTLKRLPSGMAQMEVEIHPAAVVVDSMIWNISPSIITLDTTAVKINHLAVYNKNQRFDLNGTIGKRDEDTISFNLIDADLSPLTLLVESLGYSVKGRANGAVDLVSAMSTPKMFAVVDFTNLELSGTKIGDVELRSNIDNQNKRINFSVGAKDSPPPISGAFELPDSELHVDIDIADLPLKLLDPMLSGIVSATSGSADTELELKIRGGDVLLNGEIAVKDFSSTVDFSKARYSIANSTIEVKNSSFFLPKTSLSDSKQGSGTISAALTTKNFADLKYDIQVEFNDLLALNTTIRDNSSFYGTAYGTGSVSIKGNEQKTSLNIVATTAQNSQITLPLSGAANIEEANFIRFVRPRNNTYQSVNIRRSYRKKLQLKSSQKSSSEIDINIDMTVLPNTLAQIELDAKVGDIIKGRGRGKLLMHINPTLGEFTMTGPVELTEGNYLFTLQTIINKRFVIDPGGQLVWTGDPTNPDVNLTAVYKLKTSLSPLTGDVNDKSKTDIDCGINLTDKLMTPTINFSITAPTSDAEAQNALRNALNTEEALSMQFLSLMLANSFMPDMGTSSIGTMGSSVAGVTGLEFLSNQLSNLISSERINIRLGYSPQSETSSDEFSAGVGAEIIDDVLSLEVDGNYNMQNNSSYNSQNPFSVDAYLTWNINKSGTLKLKGFTRTIDRFDETQGMQESGAGIYFSQDFNDFKDLKERLNKAFLVDSTHRAERRKEKELKKQERERKREEKKKKQAQ